MRRRAHSTVTVHAFKLTLVLIVGQFVALQSQKSITDAARWSSRCRLSSAHDELDAASDVFDHWRCGNRRRLRQLEGIDSAERDRGWH